MTLAGSGGLAFGFTSGTALTLASLTGGSTAIVLENGSAQPLALTLGGGNASATYAGNFTGLGSLVKLGTGTFTLTGSSWLAGTTRVAGGVLALGSANALGVGSGNIANSSTSGTVRVDVSGGSYTGITTSGIGTLTLTGSSSSFNGVTLQAGQLTVSPGTSATIALGSISRSAGSVLSLQSGSGTITVDASTPGSTAGTIIGPWAITGTGASMTYAAHSAGTVTGYTASGTAANNSNLVSASGSNVLLQTATGSITSAVSLNTIRYTGASGTTTIGSNSFTVNGLMNAGSGLWLITGGTMTIGTGNDLVVATGGPQDVKIESVIGLTAGRGLTFSSDNGSLVLVGAQNITGPINIFSPGGPTAATTSNSALIFDGAGGGTYGDINFNRGGYIYSIASGTIRIQGAITGVGSGITTGGATNFTILSSTASTFSGVTSILNGTTQISSLPSLGIPGSLGAPTTAANGTIGLGSTGQTSAGALRYVGAGDTTDRVVNLQSTTGGGIIDASGAGALIFTSAFTATGNGAKTLTLTGSSTANNSIVSVPDSTSATSVTKDGPGTWRLTGNSSYTGQLRVLDGTLVVASTVSRDGASAFGFDTSPDPQLGSGTSVSGTAALLSEGVSIARPILVQTGSSQVVVLGATSGTATFSGGIKLGRDVTLAASAGAMAVFSGDWTGTSGTIGVGPAPAYAITVGSPGNSGIVVFDRTLPSAITSVNVTLGTARLLGGNNRIDVATPVTVGSSLGAATLDLNGLSQTLSSTLAFGGNSGSIVSGSAGGTLRLNTSIPVSVSGSGHEISSLVALDAATTFNVAGSSDRLRIGGAISEAGGARSLTKTGLGILELAGANSFTGPTTVSAGRLSVAGSLDSAVTVQTGAVLEGTGVLGSTLTGDGLIAPGNSPGILTVQGQLQPTGSTSFAFEFTATGSPAWSTGTASINDVLRLTGSTPFTSSLAGGNVVNVYFDVASLTNGDTFLGGFFIDNPPLSTANLETEIGAATYQYFVKGSGSGTFNYNGTNYYSFEQFAATASGITGVTRSVVNAGPANFAGGTITTGQVTQFVIIPEPTSIALAGIGIAAAAWAARRRGRA